MTKSKSGKILSLLLTLLMIMSVIPMGIMSVNAADSKDYVLILDGLNGYKNEATETNKLTLADLGIASSEPETGVFEYTFTNVNFETTEAQGIKIMKDAIIKLVGENTIKVNDSKFYDTACILARKDLTIQGEGSLTITSGNSAATSLGIFGSKSLTINGGKLDITAGTGTKESYGIYCEYGITIKAGEVEATAKAITSATDIKSIGVYCKGILLMEGGTLKGTGANATATDESIYTAHSYGVQSHDHIVVTGGTITATCGIATGDPSTKYSAAYSMLEPDCKSVDTGDSAELSYSDNILKKSGYPATSATLTAKPKDYKLYIDGLTAKKNDKNGDIVDLSTLGITPSEPTTGVFEYTFNNVNFETTASQAIELKNNATINLVGENIVKGGNCPGYSTSGIYTDKNLTIQGEGSLTVVSGNTNRAINGIKCSTLSINGGKINVTAGNSTGVQNIGVDCSYFKMTNGEAEIKSGYSNESNYGMTVSKEFLMEGGSLNCVAVNNATTGNVSCIGLVVYSTATFKVIGGTVTASCDKGTGTGEYGAVYSQVDADAKVIDTDTKAILTRNPSSNLYQNGETIATKATLTAKPKDYTLFIDGLTAKKNDTNGDVVDLSTLGITPSEPTTGVFEYTFNNVNFETTASQAIELKNNATINLVGENTVKVDDKDSSIYVIKSTKNLTIQGEGSLTVAGGNAKYSTFAIQCQAFTINGGKINVTTGIAKSGENKGVKCSSFKMTNGEAEIKSNYSSVGSCGISVSDKSFLVEGGTLNCAAVNNATTGNVSCIGIAVTYSKSTFKVIGGTVTASCDKGTGTGKYGAVYSQVDADAKVIDTDTKAILTLDGTSHCYQNNTTIATKATLTAMPCEYNSTKYVSIAKVLEAIGTGTEDEHKTGTIKLLDNVKEDVTIGQYQEIKLDLNGYKLENDKSYTITNNGKLSVIDTSTDKTGEVFSNFMTIRNNSTGDITVTNIKIKANNSTEIQTIYGIINLGTCIIQGDKTEITASGIYQTYAIHNSKLGTITINAGKFTVSGSGDITRTLSVFTDKVTIGKDAEFILGTSTAKMQAAYYSNVDNAISAGKFSGPIVAQSGKVITVTGGSFTENPKDFVDTQNYKVVDNGESADYRYTVSNLEVCEYNSTKYPSIAKALETIGTGTEAEHKSGTIKLLDNVKEDVEIGEFQEITLNLNGYKLENDKTNFTINNSGKLSVIDLSTDKTGEVFSNVIAIYNKKTGDLTVKDIKIKVNSSNILNMVEGIENSGTCIIQGDKTEITASGIFQTFAIRNSGTITINAGKFTASGSGDITRALGVFTDKVTIGKDAEFILGTSTAKIQAAYYSNVDNAISAGKFSGPIVAYGTSKITVTGGSFTENPTDKVNSDTHKVVDNGNTVAYRYTVSEKADTTISAPTTVTKKYDGSALTGTASPAVTTGSNVTYQIKTTADGQYAAESTDVPSITDAGTLYVKAIARHADYKTVSVEYTLTVTQRDITFTSASDSKMFNGAPLTNSGVTVGGDGFASEEGAEYDVTGSQLEIGSSPNTFTYNFKDNTKAANYNVTTEYGTLTVTYSYKQLFEAKKQEAIEKLNEFAESHDGVVASKQIKKARAAIEAMNYNDGDDYNAKCAELDSVLNTTIDKVTAHDNYINGCPVLRAIAYAVKVASRFITHYTR